MKRVSNVHTGAINPGAARRSVWNVQQVSVRSHTQAKNVLRVLPGSMHLVLKTIKNMDVDFVLRAMNLRTRMLNVLHASIQSIKTRIIMQASNVNRALQGKKEFLQHHAKIAQKGNVEGNMCAFNATQVNMET